MSEIINITKEDKEWVKNLFEKNKEQLGIFSSTWHWYWSAKDEGKNSNEFWVGIDQLAFAHFRRKKNGVNVLYEIVVDEDARGKGLGKQLMDYIGKPLELKTRVDNEVSNPFYLKYGMKKIAEKSSKDGRLQYNIYHSAE